MKRLIKTRDMVSVVSGKPGKLDVPHNPASKKIIINFVLLILFTGNLLFLPAAVYGNMTPTKTDSTWGIDDWNVSTLNPSPAKKVSEISGSVCPWINTGMDAFKESHAGWDYTWASKDEMAKVEQGLSILDYFAWVVTQPPVTAADGTTYPPNKMLQDSNNNVNDIGGAVFNLKYTPIAGAHAFTDLHWIQAYSGSAWGVSSTGLDNGGANMPFFDIMGIAGTLPGGGAYFLDRPGVPENEYEQNPVASRQFQVVLADFAATDVLHPELGGKVTLYGGEWWGYTYTACDVPEPATITLVLIGLGNFALLRKRSQESADGDLY